MTDNEIIKALECSPLNDIGGCRKIDALDLINRQKAEIERLKGAVQEWVDGKCISQKHLLQIGKLQNEIEQAKTEAIKEFAEEFEYFVLHEDIEVVEPKCKDYESYINGANQFRHQIKNGINNLVKEMMEVNENE